MMEKRKSSNDDNPGGIIGGDGSGLVGGYGRLDEELDDLRAPRVVFGGGLRGHCRQTSQRGLAVSQDVGTGSKGRRRVFLCGWKTLGHVTRLCQKLEGGTVDGIISSGRSGITDEFWSV